MVLELQFNGLYSSRGYWSNGGLNYIMNLFLDGDVDRYWSIFICGLQARNSELSTWRILNLVRGLGAILGWVVISLRPNTDRLSKNLEKADENILGDNIEIPVVRSSGV